MAPELADPTHLQTRHFRFKLAHRFAREANGDHRPRSLARVFCRPLELRNAFGATFEFDENPLAVGNRREDCCECGNFLTGPSFGFPTSHVQLAQFVQGLRADFPGEAARPFCVAIMDDHQLAVLGKLNVNFDGVGLLLPREPDGSQRVFRRIMRRAAMGDDLHSLRQPFLPVPGELIGSFLGYRNQCAEVSNRGRVFLEVNLVDEVFDGAVTPFIDLLGQQ